MSTWNINHKRWGGMRQPRRSESAVRSRLFTWTNSSRRGCSGPSTAVCPSAAAQALGALRSCTGGPGISSGCACPGGTMRSWRDYSPSPLAQRSPAHPTYGRHTTSGSRWGSTHADASEGTRRSSWVYRHIEEPGIRPYRPSSGELRLRTCPFDPLSRTYEPIVCGIGAAIVTGVVQGVGAERLRVDRDQRPDRCCSVIGSLDDPPSGSRRSRRCAIP